MSSNKFAALNTHVNLKRTGLSILQNQLLLNNDNNTFYNNDYWHKIDTYILLLENSYNSNRNVYSEAIVSWIENGIMLILLKN